MIEICPLYDHHATGHATVAVGETGAGMIVWNVAAIIETAGGASQLRKLLARAGQDIPDNSAISMWRSRNRIPSQWSAPVLFVVLGYRPNIRVTDLMMVTGTSDEELFADADAATEAPAEAVP